MKVQIITPFINNKLCARDGYIIKHNSNSIVDRTHCLVPENQNNRMTYKMTKEM